MTPITRKLATRWLKTDLFPRRGRLAALDINNYQIKLAVMRQAGSRTELEAFHVERLDPTLNSTPGLDEEQRDALRQIVREYGLDGCDLVASLPYHSYQVRVVVLPQMPRRDLRGAVLLDMKRNTTFNEIDDICEFVSVDSFEQDQTTYENHLVATVNRERVAEAVAFFAELGLCLKGFSVPPLALRNVLANDGALDKHGVYAIVNMSHEETSFSLIHNGKLLFTREIPKAGKELTDALQTIVTPEGETIHLPRERATEIKYEYGVIDDAMKGQTTEDGIPLEHIAIMMRPVLEKMLTEIRRSIDFCREQFGVASPEHLFLAGGGAQLKNFREYLATRLHIEVGNIDPTGNFFCGPHVPKDALNIRLQSLASALGAALNVKGGQNYFVPREFVNPDYRRLRASVRAVAVASILAASTAVLLFHIHGARVGDQIEEKVATLNRLEEIQRRYANEADQLKLQQFRRDTLLGLIGPEVPWGDVLRDLSHRIGRDVQLTKLETVATVVPGAVGATERRVKFIGLISLESDRLEAVTSELLEGMNSSPYFDDIRLEHVSTMSQELANVGFSARLLY